MTESESDGVRRRLAAILYGDVVSYSRLMSADDEATLESLNACRQVLQGHVEAFQGRLVNAPGDSVLVEFPSVVAAVDCAVRFQEAMAQRNAGLPPEERMLFRIAVNLGDVLVSNGAIYGDGVNIAARLEALAEPGGINISSSVFDVIKHRPPLQFTFLGEKAVKNIPTPVGVYRVCAGGAPEQSWLASLRGRIGWAGGWRRGRAALVLVVVAVLAMVGGLVAAGVLPQPLAKLGLVTRNGVTPTWSLDLPLPEKPSLAVLPFDNLSGRPDQDWIADGFTETLITGLSRLQNLFVIARNSVFKLKGRAVDVREVGNLLHVNYVLEGSVQREGDRLRINAQLINARTGVHLWAQRYDVPADDLFHVQDRITQAIAQAMQVKLLDGELAELRRRRTTHLAAFEAQQQAEDYWYADQGGQSCDRYERTGKLYRRAIALDPRYSSAWVGLAWHRLRNVYFACGEDRAVSLQTGIDAAEQAMALDPSDPEGHAVAAIAHLFLRDYGAFQQEAGRAIELGGGNAEVLANVAWGDLYVGHYEDAERLIRLAVRLHPYYPAWYLNVLAIADLWQGNLADAREVLDVSLARNGAQVYAQVYAVVLAQKSGDAAAAKAAARRLLRSHPDFTVQAWLANSEPYQPPEAARMRQWLRAAGLP